MNGSAHQIEVEIDCLVAEIQRYLAFIDALRTEGMEPTWAAEPPQRERRWVSGV
jgi:hypothetical protein